MGWGIACMNKVKEIFIILVLLVALFTLSFLLYFPSPFVAGSENAVFGYSHYLKLFFVDKTVFLAIFNTFRQPFISSVVLIALATLILKKKVKFTRKSYYLTIFTASFIISVFFFLTKSFLYNLLCYILYPIVISLLCVIVFWVIELISDIIKRLIKVRSNE